MMSIIPNRFLVRVSHPVTYVKRLPHTRGEIDLSLPEECSLSNFADLDEAKNFADVRLGWNEFGFCVQVLIHGKKQDFQCDADKPRTSDGVSLWIDTRGDRTSHRASRTCHQFHLLPSGTGEDKDEPGIVQSKINRALQDAPMCNLEDVLIQMQYSKGTYSLAAFFPAGTLSGFDPQEHPRWGFYYAIRDQELGDQFLSVNMDFPFSDDPSLWSTLELVR